MKFAAGIALAAIIHCFPASAAIEQCRFIQSRLDREACYQRQEAALAAKQKARAAADVPQTENVDELKLEDERLARRLRSICRGC
jgi:hypothetical protein